MNRLLFPAKSVLPSSSAHAVSCVNLVWSYCYQMLLVYPICAVIELAHLEEPARSEKRVWLCPTCRFGRCGNSGKNALFLDKSCVESQTVGAFVQAHPSIIWILEVAESDSIPRHTDPKLWHLYCGLFGHHSNLLPLLASLYCARWGTQFEQNVPRNIRKRALNLDNAQQIPTHKTCSF